MIITMVLGSVLIGPMIHYFHWLGIGITYLVFLIGIIASTKLEKIKIKNDIETYDRILAFINGKDPKEVQKSKFRYIWTSLISFIFFVGVIIGISYLSIILTDYFFIKIKKRIDWMPIEFDTQPTLRMIIYCFVHS